MRPYDHATKSGNEGDVVKHVALLAALDAVLGSPPFSRSPDHAAFRYADTFAGYAQTVFGDGGAWRRGAGRLSAAGGLASNPHTALWHQWYLARPCLRGSAYPGSSLVAADVARHRGVPIALALWDVSAAAVDSLRATWGVDATIRQRPATSDEPDVIEADFLFVDPPSLASWPAIAGMLDTPRAGGTLLWLPVGRDDLDGWGAAADVVESGFAVDEVLWPTTSSFVGCRLVHRLPDRSEAALRAAVRHVAQVAGWSHARS